MVVIGTGARKRWYFACVVDCRVDETQPFPTSVNLLDPSSPQLNVTARLRYRPGVTPHTMIGERSFTVGSGNQPSSTCAGGVSEHHVWMWTFLRQEGVESTNNASERDLRHAVIERKLYFETQSAGDRHFVEARLTSIETCNAAMSLTSSSRPSRAHFARQSAPSLHTGV